MTIARLRDLARYVRDPRVLALVLAPVAVLALTSRVQGGLPGAPILAVFAVLAAGRWFGVWVGALEGLYAALLVGPWVGRLAVVATPVERGPWWGPVAFFVVAGLAAGTATQHLRRRLADEQAQRRELARVHARTLTTFANLVAHRDQPTAFHCERVAENARALGRLHGLAGQDLNELYWAGLLHDLGKISTPATILLKEGKLTDDEYDVIKQHANLGAEVLLDISPRFHAIAEGVRSHHERWDGRGYPDGLAGDEIPLFGRILAVVDVFEAMTAPRPYRGPLSPPEVLAHLRERSGLDFEPHLVELFEQLYARGLVHVYDDGQPTPTDLSAGLFTTEFGKVRAERLSSEGLPAIATATD